MNERSFTTSPAVRSRVPLIIDLAGASSSGKTKSALELATGMQQVYGGEIHVIDSERGRALHYSSDYKFHHTPFNPPYSPDDYVAALHHVRALKPGVVIVDQCSMEHDGLGGVLEWHEAELDRMAGTDWTKRDKCNMAAWIKPKAARRRLLNEIVQIGGDFAIMLCFRAKETAKPIKGAGGKMEIEDQGWLPIAGPEFLYEAAAGILLYPRSNGIPTWDSPFKGESAFIKRPEYLKGILRDGRQLTVGVGRELAEWARGGAQGSNPPGSSGQQSSTTSAATTPPQPLFTEQDPQPAMWADWSLEERGENRAHKGTAAFRAWWESITAKDRVAMREKLEGWKKTAADVPML